MKPPTLPSNAKPIKLKPVSSFDLTPSKKPRHAASCFLIIIITFFIIALAGAYVLARTGLVEIPGFSWARVIVEPTRIVEVATSTSANEVAGDVLKEIKQQWSAGSETATVTLSEEVMTALIQERAQVFAKEQDLELISGQVVALDDQLEFFGKVKKDQFVLDAIIHASPEVLEEGGMRIHILDANIGSLPIAPTALTSLEKEIPADVLQKALGEDIGDVEIVGVEIVDGQVSVTIRNTSR